MNFLADEGVDLPVVERLRGDGSVVHDHGEKLIHTFTVVTPGLVRVRPRVI